MLKCYQMIYENWGFQTNAVSLNHPSHSFQVVATCGDLWIPWDSPNSTAVSEFQAHQNGALGPIKLISNKSPALFQQAKLALSLWETYHKQEFENCSKCFCVNHWANSKWNPNLQSLTSIDHKQPLNGPKYVISSPTNTILVYTYYTILSEG